MDTIGRVLHLIPSAIKFDPDGISVALWSIADADGVTAHDFCDWAVAAMFTFRVGDARTTSKELPPTGVVRDPTDDVPLGPAHCLVRADRPRDQLTRGERKAIKIWIADRSVLLNRPEDFEQPA